MKSDKVSPRLVDINEFRGYGKALLERWVMDHPVNEIHLPLKEAMQLADYKWMAEKGLSPEAKRYRDNYIRPKKREKDHDDAERLVRDLLDDNGGQDHSEGAGDGEIHP